MRKILAMAALAGLIALTGAGVANAAGMGQAAGDISLGWWDVNTPVAVRYLLNDKTELMGGFGFDKPDQGDTQFALSGAATFRLAQGERASFGIRPRIFKEFNTPEELLAIGGDLVVEVKIASSVSVVAGHGIEYISAKNTGGGDDTTILQTRPVTGGSVGFWVKLP